ncbi:MAG: excinuclease ABC subunit UvrC [Methanomicrobiales archaeon]|nr:excinuclease ABC subunit UvrC [Methanomicrobiales archaeon]
MGETMFQVSDLATLPQEPGCYLFRDDKGSVIYIGKAKDLKRRVSSYFQRHDLDSKTRIMVGHAHHFDFIVTANEVEALLLEDALIKEHQPKYNIDLKDAKSFAYIRLTGEDFPRLEIRRTKAEGGEIFGPFTSAAERDEVFSLVKRVFRLRTCRRLPRRSCLRLHLRTCSAPCSGDVSRTEYGEQVRRATLVLRGRSHDLVKSLKEEMTQCADEEEFEAAIAIRDQIKALEGLSRRQDVARQVERDEDVLTWRLTDDRVFLILFHVYQGRLTAKHAYMFEGGEDVIEEFLVRFYSEHIPPHELILLASPDPAITAFLSTRRGGAVSVTVPQRGAKVRLLALAEKNLEETFFHEQLKALDLQEHLGLDHPPSRIECFDISHLSGTEVVGAMVQFTDGRPDKRQYRRFKIRDVPGIDDVAAIREVVRRRYRRMRDESLPLPDLVLIDGGKGQLNGANEEILSLGLSIPVFSIAKGKELVYAPRHAHPLPFDAHERALRYLQEIRDEAHRFAVGYHRLIRKKRVLHA